LIFFIVYLNSLIVWLFILSHMDTLPILRSLLTRWQEILADHFNCCNDLICDFTLLQANYRKAKLHTGLEFNLFEYFNLDEKTHSFLLADLLDPKGQHGYSGRFLEEFLTLMKIDDPDKPQDWEISTETAGVDVLLIRRRPDSVIIIENKSNYADDQAHQLYRYWYRQIYWPRRHCTQPDYKESYTYLLPEIKSRYKVLYLVPDDSKTPADISLARPSWLDPSFPAKMPIPHECWTLSNLVETWLAGCLPVISEKNIRLRTFIEAYIEFWTNKF